MASYAEDILRAAREASGPSIRDLDYPMLPVSSHY
jgi:hypothetical protein